MLASQIPTKFPVPFANNAASGDSNPIPQNSQIGITPGAASLNDGFPPVCFLPIGAGGVPPWGRDFNGLFNQISAWVQYADNAGVRPTFDATFSGQIGGYPQGAVLYSATGTVGNTDIWLSTIDNNVINPDTSYGGSGAWVALADVMHIQNELYISADDTGSVSNTIIFAPQPPPLAYQKYQRYQVKIANTTTGSAIGSVTANMYGVGANGTGPILLGAKNIVYADQSAPTPLMFTAGEIAQLVYDGTQFQVENRHPTPVIPVGSPILYVRTDGNDTNSGLVNAAAGAMRTITAAIIRAQNIWALQGKVLTIQMGIPGSYDNFGITSLSGNLTIQGDTTGTGASSYTLTGSPFSSNGMVSISGVSVNLIGLTIANTGNVNSLVVFAGGVANLINVRFIQTSGSNTFGVLAAQTGGGINVTGTATIAANAGQALVAIGGNIDINGLSNILVFSGGPIFSTATAVAEDLGVIFFNGGATISGSATGTRYNATLNGVLNTNTGNVNFIPGTIAGTTSSGGQYA